MQENSASDNKIYFKHWCQFSTHLSHIRCAQHSIARMSIFIYLFFACIYLFTSVIVVVVIIIIVPWRFGRFVYRNRFPSSASSLQFYFNFFRSLSSIYWFVGLNTKSEISSINWCWKNCLACREDIYCALIAYATYTQLKHQFSTLCRILIKTEICTYVRICMCM